MFSNFFVDNVKIRRELDCPYCQPSSLPVSGRSVWRRPHLHFPACFCSSWSRPPKPATFIRFLSLFLWNVSILSFLLSLLSSALRSCPLASFFLSFLFLFRFSNLLLLHIFSKSPLLTRTNYSWNYRRVSSLSFVSKTIGKFGSFSAPWISVCKQPLQSLQFSLRFDPDIAPKPHFLQ